MKPILPFILALTMLAGCASRGTSLGGAPTLTDERFAEVRYGMTRDETLRLLGRPDETMKFPLSRTEAWDYRYYDTWGYMASYSVTYGPEGTVVAKISRRLNDGGDHGGH
jgi:outer membrane protein assembly factor BamE (lipoprotein component of BamABCDE complex)